MAGSIDYFLCFALFCFRNLQAMQKKEPSLLVFPNSESEEGLEPLGEPNVAEPVERISEDIAQVYNIGITLTEHLKHELNSVLSGLTSKPTYAEPYNTVIIQYVLIY